MSADFYQQHRDLLERAVAAVDAREYFTHYPESPSKSVYGEDAAADGRKAFDAHLNADFELDQPGVRGRVGEEVSPFGFALGVRYPHSAPEALIEAATAALPGWRDAGAATRAGIAVEILRRINERSFEMALAVQHTTGQAFVMAFQAGGPHAQDRGLEAVAMAYAAQIRQPGGARWEKPARKGEPLRMDKKFTIVPRGVALTVACNTFPTWNGYPGIFASLVTGNPVIVKPHPKAVLPLALTVRIAREVIAEAGLDPNVITLAVEAPGERIAAELARHAEVRIVDFTGSTEFGDWLEDNARQARVFTEKAGLNTVVVDSTDDYRGMMNNLAFSLSLYSGQMCTTPQNILLPRDGIRTDQGGKSVEEFTADLARSVEKLLGDPARAVEVLGGIANDGVLARIEESASLGKVALASRSITHPEFADAVVRTPTIINLETTDEQVYRREWFGPISFVITTDSTAASLELLRSMVKTQGALTASVYSTDESVLADAESAAIDAGVHLSENLTQGVFVNQSAAFTDFHGSSANPAASATLTDPAFVATRFTVLQSRRHA